MVKHHANFGGIQAPSKQIILLQLYTAIDICEIAHYEAVFLYELWVPAASQHTTDYRSIFFFPQSTDMSVNVDDYFQMSFRGASPTCWCYHMSRQSLKCHQCYNWQLVPVGSFTVSWFGCSEDAVQEFLVLSQTLKATDIQMRKSQAENSYLVLLGFDEIMFQSTEGSLSGLNVVF